MPSSPNNDDVDNEQHPRPPGSTGRLTQTTCVFAHEGPPAGVQPQGHQDHRLASSCSCQRLLQGKCSSPRCPSPSLTCESILSFIYFILFTSVLIWMLFQFCEVGDQGSRRGNGRTEENMREEPKRQCKGDGSGDEGAGGGAGGGGGEKLAIQRRC